MAQSSSISSSDLLQLGRRLLRFAPLAALPLLTNLAVDPDTGMRRGTLERTSVDQVLAGRVVRWSANERLFQSLYFERVEAPREILVLGSSRSQSVGRAQVAGRSLWNCSISAGWLEELAVLYLRAHRSRLSPTTVVLSLDLSYFQPSVADQRLVRAFFAADFERAERELAVELVPPAERLRLHAFSAEQLLSIRKFQLGFPRGLQRLAERRLAARPEDVLAQPGDAQRAILRNPDGSFSFPPRRIRTPELLVAPTAAVEPDAAAMRLLAALVARVRADRRNVTLLLPPYRHDYASRTGLEHQLSVAERVLRARAQAWGVEVLGTFDPGASGCAFDEFRDATHPADRCFERLLAPRLSAGFR
jgi:hypothetical protein